MSLSQMRIRRPRSLANQVHDALCESLASGALQPGSRVVVEHLAAQLGVSPTPVREAIARLMQEGLVLESSSGRLQVVPLTPDYVRETFLVRGVLEGLAAELATPRMSDSQLRGLSEELELTGAALDLGNFEAHVRIDAVLHLSIYEASENPMLARELRTLEAHVNYIRGYSARHTGDHIRRSHEEHLRLIEALSGRDPVQAREVMEAHIAGARERIVKLIDFPDAIEE
ncbi:MAG TPA: GntR family transcriptional regulator [Thermomicrobiaceae bacterium]|nr:GntR family transcriptional regulator [Thermomicrobiaceae bacterium]